MGLVVWIVVSLWYIRRLKLEIKTYEGSWNKIEDLSDKNKDGDVVIHVEHVSTQELSDKDKNIYELDRDSW